MSLLGGRTAAARIVKVAPQTVGNWTSGRSTPDKTYLRRLRDAARRQASQADNASAAPSISLPPASLSLDADAEPAQPPRPRGLYALPSPGAAPQPAAQPTQPQKGRPAIPTPSGADVPAWLKKRGQVLAQIKPLTDAEAARLRASFLRSIQTFWEYADEGITATNKQRAEARIWRKIDDVETELLADWLIDNAKRSAPVAQMIRGVSRIWDMYAVGLILGPRFVETFRFYSQHGGFSL